MKVFYSIIGFVGLLVPCASIIVYRNEQDVVGGLKDCNQINVHSTPNGMCTCGKVSNTLTSISDSTPYRCQSPEHTGCNVTLLTLHANVVFQNNNYMQLSRSLSTLLCDYQHDIAIWDAHDTPNQHGRWVNATRELSAQFNFRCRNVSPFLAHIDTNLWMGQLIRIRFKQKHLELNCLLIKFRGSCVHPLGLNGLHQLIGGKPASTRTTTTTTVIITSPPPSHQVSNQTHKFLTYRHQNPTMKYVTILVVIAVITIILVTIIYRRHRSDINITLITSPAAQQQNPDYQLREMSAGGGGMFYESRGGVSAIENNNKDRLSKASYYMWNEEFQKEPVDYLQLEGAYENTSRCNRSNHEMNKNPNSLTDKGSIGKAFHNPLFEPDSKPKPDVGNKSHLLLPTYFSTCRTNEVNCILASPYCVKV